MDNLFLLKISIFHGRKVPEEGVLGGYGALIAGFGLAMPLPHQLALISSKKRQYTADQWQVLTSRHEPVDTLYKQLVFALKYEEVYYSFFLKRIK